MRAVNERYPRQGVYKTLLMALALCMVWIAAFLACGAGARADGPQRRVYDQAGLLTDVEADMLQKKAEELTGQCGMEVVLVTTDYAEGKSSESYADDFFDKLYGKDKDGVCFLIDMSSRNLWISTSGNMIYYLTDDRLENMLDNAENYAAGGNYSGVFESFLKDALAWYKQGVPKELYIYDSETGTYRRNRSITLMEALIAAIAALAAGAACVGGVVGKYRLKWGHYKYPYREKSRMNLTKQEDRFMYKHVTQRVIPRNENNGGGGSGGGHSNVSTTHTSSSGGTHGGAGRGF